MDCRTARSLLDLARPRRAELDAGEAEALDRHVNSCLECDALFRQERGIDDHISRAVRDVPVPRDLRERVLERLERDRRAWVRGRVMRVGSLAAAAVVLFILGLASVYRWVQPPPLELELFAFQEEVLSKTPATPERVEEWFRTTYGLDLIAPREVYGQPLDYALLSSYALEDLKGRPTPVLRFDNGNKRATVYILTAKQFKLGGTLQPPPPSRGMKIDVFFYPPEPAKPTQAFLFIYTNSDDLKPFVLPGGGPG